MLPDSNESVKTLVDVSKTTPDGADVCDTHTATEFINISLNSRTGDGAHEKRANAIAVLDVIIVVGMSVLNGS